MNWPDKPDFPEDAFRGTAKFYADFRSSYPAEMISDLVTGFGDSTLRRLLDLGCGPGRATLPLAPFFDETWAVDPEKEMLEEGRARTPDSLKGKIRWMASTAEALESPADHFHLITIGEAFHRMDQRFVAGNMRKWLVAGGKLAILGYRHFWQFSDSWKGAVNQVPERYKNRAYDQKPCSISFEEVLHAAGFTEFRQTEYNEPKTWTVDEIVGYLFSVSILSKQRQGNRTEQFEREIRLVLRDWGDQVEYTEMAGFQSLTAQSPER